MVKPARRLFLSCSSRYRVMVGVGGIGSGVFFALEGDHTLGRNESRPARMLDVRDYCKLHIVAHYVSVLLGAHPSGVPFLVMPIGKVGDDSIGVRLLEEMKQAGINTRFVDAVKGTPTLLSVCFQYPDGMGGNITTSESAAATLSAEDVDRAVSVMASGDKNFVALSVPEVPLRVRQHFLQKATEHGALRVASFTSSEIPTARKSGMLGMIDILNLNQDEAQALTGVPFDASNPEPLLRACRPESIAMGQDGRVILSAGQEGAFALQGKSEDYCPAAEVPVVSTAGAGDALLAGVIAGLLAGLPFISPGPQRRRMSDRPLSSALDLGCLLAGFSVTSPHTIHPDADLEILLAFAGRTGISLAPPFLQHVRRAEAEA